MQCKELRVYGFWRVLVVAGLSLCLSQSAALGQWIGAPSAQDSDLQALLEIKRALSTGSQEALKSWSIDNYPLSSYCQWTGVKCNSSSERVIELNFMNMHLEGTISAHIGKLTRLTVLNLRNNSLTGPIPADLGSCSELKNIYLDGNKLDGNIPPELGLLPQVARIKLGSNQLSGAIPPNLCSSPLEELDLSRNRLSGSIPPGFMSNCSKLLVLHLEGNQLTGPIPELIEHSSNDVFQQLFLQENRLTGPFPGFLHKFGLLRELNLSHNNLSGELPTLYSTRLYFPFDCSYNSLSGAIPKELASLECLTELYLSHNNLSGLIPRELGQNTGLLKVDLSYNHLSGPIPAFRANVTTNFQGNPQLCDPCPEAKSTSSPGQGNVVKSVAGVSAVLGAFVVVVGAFVWRERRFRRTRVHVQGPETVSRGQLFEPGLRQITVEELKRATRDFSPEHLVGKGSSTMVYRGVLENIGWRKAAAQVAVKRMLFVDDFEQTRLRFGREVESMKDLQHRNLVRILGYAQNSEVLALILEYMPGGSLDEALHGGASCTLTLDDRLRIALGVARGLVYLHHDRDEPVAHLDLKPGNVLLDAQLEPRIADFGGTRFVCPAARLDTHTMTCNFTVGYTAPEFVDYARPSTKADVYSYGILLLELLTRTRPTASVFGDCGTITQWMTNAILGKTALSTLDPFLRSSTLTPENENEILTMLHMAVNCTNRDPDRRPDMNIVLEILENLRLNNRSPTATPTLDDLVNMNSEVREVPGDDFSFSNQNGS
ncbi:hypothetical protein MPTK1_6g17260 [Marchantia polymorpha subsp. ruderalis]|uniref:Protein kinase domain-containing protein n=2 Tax=Marchantia polymorpha TaxID=3197 RepID=A0AAF6BSZ2_MARPO|nr:hypothetical protein MARPO_0184s0024 [Marchantia polymorpha]BBN15126.1 hypothetical protein Mp_6g17260 [Marchantia polymorpha subsp. ruderalis]|eukprot:PTQ27786.1 hypothetical protein MARPO_0184s0024 [Marchantia polymorpha]